MSLSSSRARVGAAIVGVALAAALLVTLLAGSPAQGATTVREAPIGIESAFSVEQAPILAEMHVSGKRVIDGMTFYRGTIGGKPVVDVLSGEINEQAELATYILDTTFHPRAVLYSGTAGAQDNALHVGDVVLSGFVDDKSGIHYYQGGYQGSYGGAEVMLTKHSDIRGSVSSYSEVKPATPQDAKNYGWGPTFEPKNYDRHIKMVTVFAAPRELVRVGMRASRLVGTTALSDATGDSKLKGKVKDRTFAGVVGAADVWTEPLSFIEAQNALYPSDAEENEGSGFAFMNAQLGMPWLLVRGISDSVWYPKAYDGPLASDHAATVVKYIVEHLPAKVSKTPQTLHELTATSNARKYGYLVADKAYYRVRPVTKIVVGGKAISGARLKHLNAEYTYKAGGLK